MSKPKNELIPESLAKAFGQRVRELRIMNTGLSQEEFADHIGVHRTIIGRTERGETNITLSNIYLICKGLGVPISDFFNDFETKLQSN